MRPGGLQLSPWEESDELAVRLSGHSAGLVGLRVLQFDATTTQPLARRSRFRAAAGISPETYAAQNRPVL